MRLRGRMWIRCVKGLRCDTFFLWWIEGVGKGELVWCVSVASAVLSLKCLSVGLFLLSIG